MAEGLNAWMRAGLAGSMPAGSAAGFAATGGSRRGDGRRGDGRRGDGRRGDGRRGDERRGAPRPPKLSQTKMLVFRVPPLRVTPDELLPPPMTRRAGADAGADAEFAKVAEQLAEAKARLDQIPPKDFEELMRGLDLYRGLKAALHRDCGMQVTTNASLKIYEIVSRLGLLPCDAPPSASYRVFCNAELPGSFIAALNHYVRTMCPGVSFDWVASSYHPDEAAARGNRAVLGDSYGFYAANRGAWLMGPRPNALPEGEPDVSGDLTDADVVAALADAVHARYAATGGATLYTSDAGTGVSDDYNRQEEATALLNFGQVVCGLLALAPGGTLVTKQFTFLTAFSRSLIALLAALFDELDVVKPLASRPANSEVYLVGRGFRGVGAALAGALLDRLAAYRAAEGTTPCDWAPLLGAALTREADAALLRAARQLHGRQQVAFLNEAADLYQSAGARAAGWYKSEAQEAQENWLLDVPVRRLPPERALATRAEPARGGGDDSDDSP